MRVGVAAVLAVLLGAFAAHFLLADRGYVLVSFRSYVVEMSVPGLVIVLVLAYVFVRALAALARAPRRWRASREQRKLERRDSDLTTGLTQLVEGNWARSERVLTKGLKRADAPLANYLLAAHAAQLQGAADRRDQWLELAQSIGEDAATSAQLTRAQLQLQAGDAAAAVETLQSLERRNADAGRDAQGRATQARAGMPEVEQPREQLPGAVAEQPAAVALLARAYRALGDREQLFALLPRLARASLAPAERAQLELLAVHGELERPDLTADRLAQIWAALPSELRGSSAVIAQRARALDRLGLGEDAERELRDALNREWHQALVESYGEIRGADPAKQLKHAEGWLKAHADDAALLKTAARLSVANELWGKARSHLEASLALSPSPEAYALYGGLLTQLGEDEGALSAFRSGLALVSPGAVEPLPPVRSGVPPRGTQRKVKG
jgi:HemY protein